MFWISHSQGADMGKKKWGEAILDTQDDSNRGSKQSSFLSTGQVWGLRK